MRGDEQQIGEMIGQAISVSMAKGFAELERRLEGGTRNGYHAPQPAAPTVVTTGGGGAPVVNVDTKTLGEIVANAVREQGEQTRAMIADLIQAIAHTQPIVRPTINVEPAPVRIQKAKSFTISHSDGTKSEVTVE